MSKITKETGFMGRVYKAILKSMGARENGTPKTSCVDDALHVKQILALVSLAFTIGALSFGFRGLPQRVKTVEEKVVRIEAISQSIDDRLARIEDALIRKR